MTSGFSLDPALGAALRGALGLLFAWAAAHKLRGFRSFRAALADYALLPRRAVPGTAAAIVALELAVAGGLFVPGSGPWPPLAGAALLSLYSGAVAINLLRGRRHIDCGCAGPSGRHPLGPGLLLRNLLLVLAALTATLPLATRPLIWLDAVTIPMLITVSALLFAAADLALANVPRLVTPRGATWSKP